MAQRELTAHTTLAEGLNRAPQIARVFVRHRMACVGCVMAPFETIADVAAVYHLPLECFLAELQQAARSIEQSPTNNHRRNL